LVASPFDTSVAMIEKAYSEFIADNGDAQMRRTLFDACGWQRRPVGAMMAIGPGRWSATGPV
jgi:hypothetical protein